MSKKICAWNINCATNKNIMIPDFVGEEIERQKSDFFILSEFCRTQNGEHFIQKYLVEKGYAYLLSNNLDGHNDILIAWKKDKYSEVKKETTILTDETTPNFAYVLLKDTSGVEFVLAGVRITIESYENRKQQLCFVLERLRSFQNVVIGGDFNCLRRGTPERKWNLSVLSQVSNEAGFQVVTPKGQSIYAENAIKEEYEFAEDHFLVKGMRIVKERYDRDFTTRNNGVYMHGKDFSVYDARLQRTIWSVKVGSGIPDHAILSGYLEVDDSILRGS